MRCAWKELLSILPDWMRADVDELGKDSLQELRLRIGHPPELVRMGNDKLLCRNIQEQDLSYIVNMASRYSPWAATTSAQGYLTAPGGHRIGLCGEAVIQRCTMTGLRQISSLCIRIARDLPGIAQSLGHLDGSVLIIGRPGSGKTTLLRDLIRYRSRKECVAVVDERGEIFPQGFDIGSRKDILTGCPKPHGIDILLRTMGPSTIAVDEITAASDCQAMIRAGWCGVRLLATAHAASRADLESRPVYRPLVGSKLFDSIVILRSDKSWRLERMEL